LYEPGSNAAESSINSVVEKIGLMRLQFTNAKGLACLQWHGRHFDWTEYRSTGNGKHRVRKNIVWQYCAELRVGAPLLQVVHHAASISR
jgi:hypothetical protein